VRLKQGHSQEFALPKGHTLALVVLRGEVVINGQQTAHDAQWVLMDRAGSTVSVQANRDSTFLMLGGEPIDEPVVGYGPFVMNDRDGINQAIEDFNRGAFGQIGATAENSMR